MNMAVVVLLVFFVFQLCPMHRRWKFLGTIIFLFFYALLTGWSAPVVRACIMASVILASFAFEYDPEPMNSLGLAGLILLLADAHTFFDIGFQLSFAAVLGIFILHRPLAKRVGRLMAVSLAAWIGTTPLQIYHFGTFTPVAILANIPIVPLADIVVLLGLLLSLAGLWCPWLAYPIAGCTKVIFNLMWAAFKKVPFMAMAAPVADAARTTRTSQFTRRFLI